LRSNHFATAEKSNGAFFLLAKIDLQNVAAFEICLGRFSFLDGYRFLLDLPIMRPAEHGLELFMEFRPDQLGSGFRRSLIIGTAHHLDEILDRCLRGLCGATG
jgi:hypothetical protein